jgi:hypothetical protein
VSETPHVGLLLMLGVLPFVHRGSHLIKGNHFGRVGVLLGSCDPPGSWPDHKSVFILKGGQSRRSVPGALTTVYYTNCFNRRRKGEKKLKGKEKKKKKVR